MSCRTEFRKLSLFSFAVLVTVAALAFSSPAQVIPASIFELDGNSTQDGNLAAPDCDWNPLNDSYTTNQTSPAIPCVPSGTTANGYGFLEGAPGEPAFTTGGSKDSKDVSSWAWSITSTPDKDTLTHGYGQGYTDTGTGQKLLIFGAERFATNGDSNIGIWFFQQSIGLTPAPPPAGTATKGTFTGLHQPGDILIVSAFTAGGGASTISVYQWAPAGSAATLGHADCPNSNYPNITTSGAVNVCAAQNLFALFFDVSAASSSSSDAFAIVNPAATTIGWPYESKFGGTANSVPQGGFYEGGINLTALIGGGTAPCFASFLFETRSSQATNAVLKDFLVGSFPQCHLSIQKACTCNSFNADGSFNYSYGGDVINDGGGDLFNIVVTDTPANGGASATYNCGNLPRGTSATPPSLHFPSTSCVATSGTNTWSTTAHESSNTANATAQTASSGGTTIDAIGVGGTTKGYTATCTDLTTTSCTFHGSLELTKDCVTAFQASSSNVVVRVDYDGTVKNTGTVNLSSVVVHDDVDNGGTGRDFTIGTLTPSQKVCYSDTSLSTCPVLSVTDGLSTAPASVASYFPSSANVFGLSNGRISFTDTVSIKSAKDPAGGDVTATPASATCVICPSGACSTTTH